MEDESLREILISLHKMKQKLLLREDSEDKKIKDEDIFKVN